MAESPETTPIPVSEPDGYLDIQGLAEPRPDVEFNLDRKTGVVSIATPNGAPEAVTMPFRMLTGVVEDLNNWRELVGLLQIQIAALRIGNRPNAQVRERISYLLKHFGVEENE